MRTIPLPLAVIEDTVGRALAEDVGAGDLSLAAVPAERDVAATIVAREAGVVCGRPFVDEVFVQLGGARLDWTVADGEAVEAGQELVHLSGPTGVLLTGERTALNLLQTLSGTATATAAMVRAVAGTGVRILDTRKTLPGLRTPQKYAVRVGGGHNHRHGLFDGVLLKENHLAWAGGLAQAVAAVRDTAPHTARIQVEVEDLDQMREGLACGVDALLLDNFSLDGLRTAVAERPAGTFLEASGNIDLANVRETAATGVDGISSGALTRDLASLDLSMRFKDGAD
jgi:nicotinate-nucleotide pyrophosphorylase (carboxylating)